LNVLGIHTGAHDASACLFRDFELVAAVSLERLTRRKNSGVDVERPLPDAAIDAVPVHKQENWRRRSRFRRHVPSAEERAADLGRESGLDS
jgi:predicted NodU family carbamoyl transferase